MHYHNLLETLPEPGCALCKLVERGVARYLDALLYEYSNKVPTHQAFRAGRGLCSVHSHQLQDAKGSALNLGILFSHVLDEVRSIDASTTGNPAVSGMARLLGRSPLAESLAPTGPCIACEVLLDTERHYVEVVSEHLDDAALRRAFTESDGFCLPHVRILTRALKDTRRVESFMAMQRAHWAALYAELDTFTDKFIADRTEAFGAEGDSWRRAILMLTGAPGVFGLRR